MNSTVKETVIGILPTASATWNDHDSIPRRFGSSLSIRPNAFLSRYRSSGCLTAVKTERTTTVRSRPWIFIFLSHLEGLRNQSEHISEKTSIYYRPAHWHAVPMLITQILAEKTCRRCRAKRRTQTMSRCGLIFGNVRRFSWNYTVFTEPHGFRGTTRFSRDYTVFTELRGFHGTTRFSRDYTVFTGLHGFHGTTLFSRNHTVFAGLHGFRGTTRFSRNYAVFTEPHGFRGTTRFSRNYAVLTELRGFHGATRVNVISYTTIRKVRPFLRRSLPESQIPIIMYWLPCTEFHSWSKNVWGISRNPSRYLSKVWFAPDQISGNLKMLISIMCRPRIPKFTQIG